MQDDSSDETSASERIYGHGMPHGDRWLRKAKRERAEQEQEDEADRRVTSFERELESSIGTK